MPGLSEQNASVVLSEQSAGPTRLAKQDGLAELAGLSGLGAVAGERFNSDFRRFPAMPSEKNGSTKSCAPNTLHC